LIDSLDLDGGYDINISTKRCETLGLTDIVSAVKRGKGEHQTLELGAWAGASDFGQLGCRNR
jgi:hypothetical protein